MNAIMLYHGDHPDGFEGEEVAQDAVPYNRRDAASVEAAREALIARLGVDLGPLLAPPPSRLRRLMRWVSEPAAQA